MDSSNTLPRALPLYGNLRAEITRQPGVPASSEVNRETFFNLLINVLPAEEASQITVRATRKVLSAMCQMAFDEG